jgi:hypothetical protein
VACAPQELAQLIACAAQPPGGWHINSVTPGWWGTAAIAVGSGAFRLVSQSVELCSDDVAFFGVALVPLLQGHINFVSPSAVPSTHPRIWRKLPFLAASAISSPSSRTF